MLMFLLSSRLVPLQRPLGLRLRSRYVLSVSAEMCLFLPAALQSVLSSRATLASATLVAVGSIAWYTSLYGTLPFIGEVHANSPAEEGLHPHPYPWSHSGLLDTFDHAR